MFLRLNYMAVTACMFAHIKYNICFKYISYICIYRHMYSYVSSSVVYVEIHKYYVLKTVNRTFFPHIYYASVQVAQILQLADNFQDKLCY